MGAISGTSTVLSGASASVLGAFVKYGSLPFWNMKMMFTATFWTSGSPPLISLPDLIAS